MESDKRIATRFKEMGKVSAPEICALPGILDDISATGCKVHYTFPVVVDLENEYELQLLTTSNFGTLSLNLRVQPQWVKEIDGTTTIGFEILYSPDASRLSQFISHLEKLSEDQLPEIK